MSGIVVRVELSSLNVCREKIPIYIAIDMMDHMHSTSMTRLHRPRPVSVRRIFCIRNHLIVAVRADTRLLTGGVGNSAVSLAHAHTRYALLRTHSLRDTATDSLV